MDLIEDARESSDAADAGPETFASKLIGRTPSGPVSNAGGLVRRFLSSAPTVTG